MTMFPGEYCGGNYGSMRHWVLYYELSGSYKTRVNTVMVNSAQSQTFLGGVGLRRGCLLSPILFVIFMGMITRCNLGKESVRFGNRRVVSTPMTRFCWLPHSVTSTGEVCSQV